MKKQGKSVREDRERRTGDRLSTARFLFMILCGAAESRTPVQTCSTTAFYMLIPCWWFGLWQSRDTSARFL